MSASVLSIPEPGFLIWPGGPPNLDPGTDGGGSFIQSECSGTEIAVQTAFYYFEIDTREARITRFMTKDGPVQATIANAKSKGVGQSPNGSVKWRTKQGNLFVTANPEVRYQPEYFPVRIIESGYWFQHFAIHDLHFKSEDLKIPDGEFWMEILAWPNRLRIILKTRDKSIFEELSQAGFGKSPEVTGYKLLQSRDAGYVQVLENEKVYTCAVLEYFADNRIDRKRIVNSEDGRISVGYDEIEGIEAVKLASLDYGAGKKTRLGTPVRLGASADYMIRLNNPDDKPVRVDLKVILPDGLSMVGHCMMLLDGKGNQTGIPVQISKNWHRKELDHFVPYMGPWSHGRISLVLPPNFDENFTLRLIQGDYGQYNTASIAQLSLIGWGGNGIWIQSALGSWGETLCLQPGRVLRRTMVTDWRPFKTYSMGEDQKQYGWTSNAGGADVFVYYDKDGEYVPFIRNKYLLSSYGPCLAQMDFSEISQDGKVAVNGTWFLPQTNDFARAYLKVRCDILEDLEFSRFSIIQLGADRYNANLSTAGAVGNTGQLIKDVQFEETEAREGYISDPVPMTGSNPWITLYGDAVNPESRLGQAQRVAIVHDWQAVLGGRKTDSPNAAFYKHSFHRKDNFAADLVPGPGLLNLKKGDYIDMTLELTLLPLSESAYYGSSTFVSSLLKDNHNDWETARILASHSQPLLKMANGNSIRGPLPRIRAEELAQGLFVTGTRVIVPLQVLDVDMKGTLVALNEKNKKMHALNQEWRLNARGKWDVVVLLDPQVFMGPLKVLLQP